MFDEKLRMLGGEVLAELDRACELHKGQNSLHEGYAVLLEEVEEFWDLVKMNRHKMSPDELRAHMAKVRSELIQVSAMAMRTIHDVVDVVRGPV